MKKTVISQRIIALLLLLSLFLMPTSCKQKPSLSSSSLQSEDSDFSSVSDPESSATEVSHSSDAKSSVTSKKTDGKKLDNLIATAGDPILVGTASKITSDEKYKIFVLDDSRLKVAKNSKIKQAPYDVDAIVSLYTQVGHKVTKINADSFASEKSFNVDLCDILVIPNGPTFPHIAEENFKKFVLDGGRLITMGGYTFSEVIDVLGKTSSSNIKTSLGSNKPTNTDVVVRYSSSHMPLFDIDYTYKGVTKLAANPVQSIFGGTMDVSSTPLEGYGAVTVIGDDKRRWQPLLDGYDATGERIGTVGAILYLDNRNTAAKTYVPTWNSYVSSAIAFFGVTNVDLIKNSDLKQGFQNLPYYLMNGVYSGVVTNKYDNYRDGESPVITARVENIGKKAASGKVVFNIYSEKTQKIVFTKELNYSINAKSRESISATWSLNSFADDFYYVYTYVYNKHGQIVDIHQTGFSVWKKDVVAKGLKYVQQDNYVNIYLENGEKRPVFITGVDDGPEIYLFDYVSPVVFKKDFVDRQDMGMYLYENLQQYSWAGNMWKFSTAEEKERYYRKVDNAVYLAQKYQQIYMMGIAIGDDCAVSESQMQTAIETTAFLTKRYKDVPGLIYYLNGDLRIELKESLNSEFRKFLNEKYKTDAALQKAWSDGSVKISTATMNLPSGYKSTWWRTVKDSDINYFRGWLASRWISILEKKIREIDKSGKAVLCEFYAVPADIVDVNTQSNVLTYSNIGYFYPDRLFPQHLATSDMRSVGKSFGVGEYGLPLSSLTTTGSMYHTKTHPYEETRGFIFNVFNLALSMGANHIHYWGYQEGGMYSGLFMPNYQNDFVHKEVYYWLRNQSLFSRNITPVYKPPQVAVLMPDETRLSAAMTPYAGHTAMQNLFETLQRMQLGDILAINDSNLVIDKNLKVIFYPISYNPSDSVYNKLKSWVESGGILYVSGDISYDESRKQTKTHRLKELAGVTLTEELYPGLDHQIYDEDHTYTVGGQTRKGQPNNIIKAAGATILASDTKGNPILTVNTVNKGKVIFNADSAELFLKKNTQAANAALYKTILDYAGIKPLYISTNSESIRLFQQDVSDGGKLINIYNDALTGKAETTVEANGIKYTVSGYASRSDMLLVDKKGNLQGAMLEGTVKSGGKTVLKNETLAHIFTKDNKPLSTSLNIVVMPNKTGAMTIASSVKWNKCKVIYGQLKGGVFSEIGDVKFNNTSGAIQFDVTDKMVGKIILICQESSKNALKTAMEQSVLGKAAKTVG